MQGESKRKKKKTKKDFPFFLTVLSPFVWSDPRRPVFVCIIEREIILWLTLSPDPTYMTLARTSKNRHEARIYRHLIIIIIIIIIMIIKLECSEKKKRTNTWEY